VKKKNFACKNDLARDDTRKKKKAEIITKNQKVISFFLVS